MKYSAFLIFIIFSCLVNQYIWSQPTSQQMINMIGRGINLGNVLSAPIEGNWAPTLQLTYVQDVATAGFTTVRIPMDFFGSRTSGDTSVYSSAAGTAASYTGTASDYVVSASYLDRVEEVVNWGLTEGLVVILDFHGKTLKDEFLDTFDPTIQGVSNPLYTYPTSAKRAADNEKFRAIWAQIANRLKNYSYDLLFEIINEPFFRMTAQEMDILNTDIISIIRASGSNNVDRNIIITGGGKNSYEAPLQIGDAVLNSDNHLIATFHYYLPRDFTASSEQAYNDFDWGTALDKSDVDTNFDTVQTWSTTKNIPVLLGEFGADNECGYDYINNVCGDYGGPDATSRVAYYGYLAEAALSRGFAFTAWDAGDESNKTIYKVSDRSWVEDVKNALLNAETLGVKKVTANQTCKIYPNPASKYVNIKANAEIMSIKFFNLLGQQYTISDNFNAIDISNLKEGLYLLKVVFKDGRSTNQKLLIHNTFTN